MNQMTCKSGNSPCWTKRWTLCWTFSCPPYRSGLDGEIHRRGIGCSGSTCGLRQGQERSTRSPVAMSAPPQLADTPGEGRDLRVGPMLSKKDFGVISEQY